MSGEVILLVWVKTHVAQRYEFHMNGPSYVTYCGRLFPMDDVTNTSPWDSERARDVVTCTKCRRTAGIRQQPRPQMAAMA